jgi:cellulose synthase/poly-beta-1,6-N-acetylglucosamine synthase-like glycosyltransferase/peptidoglycan/xylan/chitin deacetylase (PgdA/CDA1 family)/spore germination protein YaaH
MGPAPAENARVGGDTFVDPTGRRWARIRIGALVAGVVSTVLLVFTAIGIFIIPPILPNLPLRQSAADSLGIAARRARPQPRRPISVRAERERVASRQRLFDYLRQHPGSPSLRYTQMPIAQRHRQRPDRLLAARPTTDPIVAGFYVNWDDNSLASLRSHLDALDWIVAEWGFVGRGGDTLPVRFEVDRRVLALAAHAKQPPQVLALITNFTGEDFDPRPVARMLRRPALRRRALDAIVATLVQYDLAGVTVDFEQIPEPLHPDLLAFLQQLRARLAAQGRLVTVAVPGDDPSWPLERYAAVADRMFVMLYDEHDPSDEPGPIASQAWFERHLSEALAHVPAAKLLVGLGQYGYEWSDTSESALELTFQDVMQLARDNHVMPAMDPGTLNPTFAWDEADSISHIVWYLDAPTAFNQMRRALPAGVAGFGVWRLGSEDPSLWTVLSRDHVADTPVALDTIRIGYDVEFIGTGEILRMVAEPTLGARTLIGDPQSGLVVREAVTRTPSTYVIRRYGRRKHAVALTFDDGPDPVWTPMILDTLRAHHAPATFFIIGENAEVHPELLRRILREGHEVGNHTFTHPNLALVSPQATRFELNATERLIEAMLGRRTALFRPPYFGDAEPTTADELVPISVAQQLGYVTVGLRDDPGDWAQPGVDSIVRRSLDQRSRGNVILLHDGGGDRRQTVGALGPLIDSLRARGDTLTTVTSLAGLTRDQAMPELPPSAALRRFVELTSFSLAGWIELGLHTVFLIAMVLGVARLLIILGLAVWQRVTQRHARRGLDPGFRPTVTVLVPAYNEEAVVVRTVASLLAQDAAPLEIIVVDDGSTDRTFPVLQAAYHDHPQVRLFHKTNGGKASALNFGVAYARGEVIVALDADTVFVPGTIRELVAPLADPRVGAVAGNAKVGNRINLVTRWQAIEYVTSQNIDRRAFSLLNCITVVPGAVGAWRRQLILDAGGFSPTTLAEDQDLTMAVLKHGTHVAYADHAVAFTEAPDTLRALARQRFRWSFGTLQCAWKHRDALFRPRYGTLGFVGLPNVWIFQLLFPLISPIADLLFLWSLLTVYLNYVQHGPEYAVQRLLQVVVYYAVFLAVDWLAAVIALMMEQGEERWLSWLVLLQRFAYRQVMYWVVVQAVMAALKGRTRTWGKLERKGTVTVAGAP